MGIRVIRPGDGEQAGGGRSARASSRTVRVLGTAWASWRRPFPLGLLHSRRNTYTMNTRKSLFITPGKVRFTSGTDDVDVEAGTVVVVPIGVPHTFSNPFQEKAVFIGTMTPDLYIQ